MHPCTLGTCPILPWWGPWPLWSPPPPPEQFLLRFLNPGMNLGQGESCEPQTSQLLLFLNQQGSPGPHPTPGSATSASGQSHRHPGTARPPPPGVPQLSAGTASPGHAYRQPRVLWLCRSAPRDTCRMLRVMSRPPEQVVFQVSWSAGFFK